MFRTPFYNFDMQWCQFSLCLAALKLTLADNLTISLKESNVSDSLSLVGQRCGTKSLTVAEMACNHQLLSSMVTLDKVVLQDVKIPVYFHIIRDSKDKILVPSKVIYKQIEVLNHAYRQTGFSFMLKKVIKTKNDGWSSLNFGSSQEEEMKNYLHKGNAGSLNIYTIINPKGILGWATFPSGYESAPTLDGIVLDSRTLPGGSMYPYDEGATLAHEVGHWLGLYHTFQGGCEVKAKKGDLIVDTPAVASPNFGCPSKKNTNSCPGEKLQLDGNDPVHNYMDYVDDRCMKKFTKDQILKMKLSWKAYRS